MIQLIVLSISLLSFADDRPMVWGRIVAPAAPVAGVAHKYFIYYEDGGKAQAYPIDTSAKSIAALVGKNVDQMVRI